MKIILGKELIFGYIYKLSKKKARDILKISKKKLKKEIY